MFYFSKKQAFLLTPIMGCGLIIGRKQCLARVIYEENGRYDMHELLRQFSWEKLNDRNGRTETEAQHGRTYLQFISQHKETIHQESWVNTRDAIEGDLANIRQAWRWAVTHLQITACAESLRVLSFFTQ